MTSFDSNNSAIPVGILGATGAVGKKFVVLLENHKWFKIACLGASTSKAERTYGEVVKWNEAQPLGDVKNMKLQLCEPEKFAPYCRLVFSALDAGAAGTIERMFAESGFAVFSNSSTNRMVANVPILIPGINRNHLQLASTQKSYNKGGFIVCNSNCSATGLCIALAPLRDAFGGIEKLFVTTMQAVSGAGYPGLPSMDIINNVVPFIEGEEQKLESEPLKILGKLNQDMTEIEPAVMTISALCHRVPVIDGHTLSVSVKFRDPPPSSQIVRQAKSLLLSGANLLDNDRCHLCPSWPKPSIIVHEKDDRPQPRLDCSDALGMVTSIGRLRLCSVHDLKFTITSHNRIAGAAGGSILNAEVAVIDQIL